MIKLILLGGNGYSEKLTPVSRFVVPEVLEVQVVPSVVVRIVPEKPTTTKVLFPYAPPLSFSDVPEVLEVHVVPSDEVRMVAFPRVLREPTTTKVPFP